MREPMLAQKDVNLDQFPWFVQPKYDGVRVVLIGGVPYSKKMKPLPNRQLREYLSRYQKKLAGLDGEIIVGDPTMKPFRRSQSWAKKEDKEVDNWSIYVYDLWSHPGSFERRLAALRNLPDMRPRIKIAPTVLVHSMKKLLKMEADHRKQGYEGSILRQPGAHYKFGRASKVEGQLVKRKLVQDAEAVIVGYEEEFENLNPQQTTETGRKKRSSHKANKRPKGRLGALVCETPEGVQFNVGSGFKAAERAYLWKRREKLIGQTIKYSSQEGGGYDAPRFPVFIAFRDVDL